MIILLGDKAKEYDAIRADFNKAVLVGAKKEREAHKREKIRVGKQCTGGEHKFDQLITHDEDMKVLIKSCEKCTLIITEYI